MTPEWLDTLRAAAYVLFELIASREDAFRFALRFIPFVLFFELPLMLLVVAGVLRHVTRRATLDPRRAPWHPRVSCIVTCYSEGEAVRACVRTLLEQVYDGAIEVIAVVDGANANRATLAALERVRTALQRDPRRSLVIVPKWQRGGRVSTLNAGLSLARGEIVLAVDADTSFDNTAVAMLVRHFRDPQVAAVAGTLRVRNARESLPARMQALEYALSIHTCRIGLGEWNALNNVSGAFGAFRRRMLEQVGGWNTGTAEDLDLTLRLKAYFGRAPLRILFEPEAIGHTDAPPRWRDFFRQRLRWDGDLLYIYLRKHRFSLTPRVLGGWNLFMTIWYGLFFQVVLPLLIVAYTVWLFAFHPTSHVLGVLALIYLVYFAIAVVLYALFLLAVSERPRQDLRLLPCLPLLPIFSFAARTWSALAILNEAWRNAHEESAMAPWWVLRRAPRL